QEDVRDHGPPGGRAGGGRAGSGHPLVRGDGEELDVVVGEADLGEQGDRLVVARGVEGGACAAADGVQLLADDQLDQVAGDPKAVVEGDVVVQPLPDLGPGDLGGCGVLHQVEDGHRAVAAEPGGQVLQGDTDVVAEARLGYRAGGLRHRQQVLRGDADLVPQPVQLVGPVAERGVEHLLAQRDRKSVV